MREKNTEERQESRVCFEQLEQWARQKVQCWLQELLGNRDVRTTMAYTRF